MNKKLFALFFIALLPLISCTKESNFTSHEVKTGVITEELRAAANVCDYTFNPKNVVIKESSKYDYTIPELTEITNGLERKGKNIVYVVAGKMSVGWAGDISIYYAELFLWDDGIYSGLINNAVSKGFWYNSSLEADNKEKDSLVLLDSKDKTKNEFTKTDHSCEEYLGYIAFGNISSARGVSVKAHYYYPLIGLGTSLKSPLSFPKGTPVYDSHGRDFTEYFDVYFVFKDLSYYKTFLIDDISFRISNPDALDKDYFEVEGQYEIIFSYEEFNLRIPFFIY